MTARKAHLLAAVLFAAALLTGLGRPAPAAAVTNCVAAEEATTSGSDDGPPKFTSPFFRVSLYLDVSLDGLEGQDASLAGSDTQAPAKQPTGSGATELPLSIESVCHVPRRFKSQAVQLSGTDGIARITAGTRVVKDHQLLREPARTDELGGADTAAVRGRLLQPKRWSEDEDGGAIPTFSATRIDITD